MIVTDGLTDQIGEKERKSYGYKRIENILNSNTKADAKEFGEKLKKDFNDWIFGCDICQDVCPWNKFSIPNKEPLLNPKNEINQYSKKDWLELTDEVFKVVFKGSPIERTKFNGLKRNIQYANE